MWFQTFRCFRGGTYLEKQVGKHTSDKTFFDLTLSDFPKLGKIVGLVDGIKILGLRPPGCIHGQMTGCQSPRKSASLTKCPLKNLIFSLANLRKLFRGLWAAYDVRSQESPKVSVFLPIQRNVPWTRLQGFKFLSKKTMIFDSKHRCIS